MPIRFQLDHDRRLLKFETEGNWDTEDMVSVVHDAYAASAGVKDYDIFSDSRATDTDLSSQQVSKLAELMLGEGEMFRGRRAAVVVSRPATYGMIRMLSARAGALGLDIRPFYSVDDAFAFLAEPRSPTE